MGRNEHFEEGHGKKFIRLPEEVVQAMIHANNLGAMQASLSEHSRTAPVDVSDHLALKQHLIMSHYFEPDETEFFSHGVDSHSAPGVWRRHRHDENQEIISFNHDDLMDIHDFEHNGGQYAQDYPHTTIGTSHFHH